MLPEDTKKLEYLNEEAGYFTNQVYREARRVVIQDYAMGRSQLVDMGEQMNYLIYDI